MMDACGSLLDENALSLLEETFRRDGIAVLKGVIPHDVLDIIGARLDFDSAWQIHEAALVKAAEENASSIADGTSFSGNVAALGLHLEQGLPRTSDLIFPSVLANPIIEQCVERLLGPAFCRYYNGNTACPGSGTQPLHMDGGGWSVKNAQEAADAGLEWPHEPMKLSVNFGVDAMLPSNGSTEVFLGSHNDTRAADGTLTVDEVAEMRTQEGEPSTQVTVPKGGVVFRDLRVFHRGVQNTSALPRHMMCVGFNAERDPAANCSHLGKGKVPHVFGDDERTRSVLFAPGRPTVDRNVVLIPAKQVDHFGNALSADEEEDSGDTPYQRGQRGRFWLPSGLISSESGVAPQLPDWARKCGIAGESLRGPSSRPRL